MKSTDIDRIDREFKRARKKEELIEKRLESRAERSVGDYIKKLYSLFYHDDKKIYNLKDNADIKKILLPTAGGPNARVAFEWASWLVKQNKGQLTLLCVVADETQQENALKRLQDTRKDTLHEPERVSEKIVVAKNVVSTILTESEAHDLLIIGASKEGLWRRIRFGSVPEKNVRSSPIPVLVVRKHEGIIRTVTGEVFHVGKRGNAVHIATVDARDVPGIGNIIGH